MGLQMDNKFDSSNYSTIWLWHELNPKYIYFTTSRNVPIQEMRIISVDSADYILTNQISSFQRNYKLRYCGYQKPYGFR